MSIEAVGRALFARGEALQFLLDDDVHAVEVLGEISWVDCAWAEVGADAVPELKQRAGVRFRRVLSAAPAGIWKSIDCRAEESS